MLESYCRPALLVADGWLPFLHSQSQSVVCPTTPGPLLILQPGRRGFSWSIFCLGLLEILSWKILQRPVQRMWEAMKRPKEFTARPFCEFWVPPSSLPSTLRLSEPFCVCLLCHTQGFLAKRGSGRNGAIVSWQNHKSPLHSFSTNIHK